jgi:hypothetical protein
MPNIFKKLLAKRNTPSLTKTQIAALNRFGLEQTGYVLFYPANVEKSVQYTRKAQETDSL